MNLLEKVKMAMEENEKQKIIEALFTVIDELEEKPINDSRSNEIIIEILSERIETITKTINHETREQLEDK